MSRLLGVGVCVTLLACDGGNSLTGSNIDASAYSEVWASTLSYRSLSEDELANEGSTDTGVEIDELLHFSVSDGGQSRRVTLSVGPSLAESTELATMQLTTKGELSIQSLDGVEQDPAIVLLERNFSDGGVVTSGDWTVTTTLRAQQSTWYGSFDFVVDVSLDGPSSSSAPSLIRLARDIGPVQFSWGDYAGDLAWYDP